MPLCSAYGCNNSLKQPVVLKQWIHVGDLRAYCLALCWVHFEEKCFDVDMYHQLMG